MAGASILFVEDNVPFRRGIATLLERCGYAVIEVGSAYEALAVHEEGIPVDLALVDLAIPGRDDALVIARARRAHGDRPVLYLSGYQRADAERLFDMPPGAAFLAKPFTAAELLAAIERLLAPPHDPDAA